MEKYERCEGVRWKQSLRRKEAPQRLAFFYQHEKPFRFPKRHLKEQLKNLLRSEQRFVYDIRYVFCTDPFLRRLNQKFLQQGYLTDVIAFDLSDDLSDSPHKKRSLQAEVYLSLDRIKAQHKRFGATLAQELFRVAFHGTLHLCGYTDRDTDGQTQMRERENHYLALAFPVGTDDAF